MKFSLGKYLLPTYVVLTFLFLSIPIVYTFIFSFNDSIKSNIIWRGFTLDNWLNVCQQQEVCDAFGNSLIIAVSATILATVLGTMIAIALVRYRFKFRSATNLLLFLPLATPEVVMGAGLAAQFLDFGWQKGLPTVIIAHTMFTLSFVPEVCLHRRCERHPSRSKRDWFDGVHYRHCNCCDRSGQVFAQAAQTCEEALVRTSLGPLPTHRGHRATAHR